MEPVSLQASRYATTSLPPILGRVIFPDGPTFTEARSGGRRVVSAFEKSARQPTLQAWRLAPRVGIGLILTPMSGPGRPPGRPVRWRGRLRLAGEEAGNPRGPGGGLHLLENPLTPPIACAP